MIVLIGFPLSLLFYLLPLSLLLLIIIIKLITPYPTLTSVLYNLIPYNKNNTDNNNYYYVLFIVLLSNIMLQSV